MDVNGDFAQTVYREHRGAGVPVRGPVKKASLFSSSKGSASQFMEESR
jgi:hypothetical protein